ncbi:MAG: hypothetical protein IJS65_05230 [Clostridia bacterium]|nr:hypothetical protein [Clostridia bacterium]
MKKTVTLLLVLALALILTLSLTGCGKEESPPTDEEIALIDVSDLDAVKELNHKLFVANLPETVFKNHESFAVTWSMHAAEDVPDQYCYMTEGRVYSEWSNGVSQYTEGRVYYVATYAPNDYSLTCALNLNPDASISYAAVIPADESRMFNYDTDVLDKVFEQDGKIHLQSHYTEEGSKNWLLNNLGRERAGENVYSEVISDADTYELESMTIYLEKDGERTVAFTGTARYDVPTPAAAETLLSFFRRGSENMMTVTMITDNGTEDELSVSVTLPKNTECSYVCDDPLLSFDDPGYKTLTHWDRLSDRTFYYLRNPDEETVARYEKLVAEMLAE